MRVVGYVRVSRVAGRAGESFISPAQQRQQVEAYAAANGHEVVAWFEDLDQSGSKASRPEFDRALEAVETKQADGLIVAKLDRFMRSLVDALDIIERIERAGGQLISVSDNFDATTPMGRFARDLVLRLGQLERERIIESWQAATSAALDRGAYLAAAPTGYRKADDGRLEPNLETAPVVVDVFRRRARGATWADLARFMTAAGVWTPFGNPNWTGQSVKRLVGNVAYLGYARQGDRVNRKAHDALVSRAEWEAAQRPRVSARPKVGDGLLLVGLARCASCRYRLKGHRKTGSYGCAGHSASGNCPHPTSVRAAALDEFVLRTFWAQFTTTTVLEPVEATAALEAATAAVETAEHELDSYVATALVDVVGAEVFRRGVEARQHAVDEARSCLANTHNGAATVGLPLDLREAWDELTLAERRTILTGAIDAVAVWPSSGRGKRDPLATRVRVVWRGEAPPKLPGSGRVAYTISPWPGSRPTGDAEAQLGVAGA